MTREQHLSEKQSQINAIKKQIEKIEKKNALRIKREKPTKNISIQIKRIGKSVESILAIRTLLMQAYMIQSQPIAPDVEQGGKVIEADRPEIIITPREIMSKQIKQQKEYFDKLYDELGTEILIIPHVPPEERQNPDRD